MGIGVYKPLRWALDLAFLHAMHLSQKVWINFGILSKIIVHAKYLKDFATPEMSH